ncbi:MAG: PAS domain-containing protein [Candidatus Saganbacteria bacterium]|nr:PAS domain-containing protein [Candidatus Saganbacteria bacterium]
MAMFYPYFELAASLFILLLCFQIYTRHYTNKVARFYSYFALIAFLAAILTFSLRIALTLELARNINRISASVWCFVFAMYAHFALIFARKWTFLKSKLSSVILYLPPALLSLLFLFTNQMYSRYEITPVGIVSQPAPLYSLFILLTVIYTIWGITLFIIDTKGAPQETERKQALIIAAGSILAIVIGITSDQIIPLVMQVRYLPPTAVFSITLLNLSIFLAMRKYSLFAISPAFAADIIIKTMPDAMLATDLEGKILFINEEYKKLFCDKSETCVGTNISSLFKDPQKYQQLFNEVVFKKKEILRFEAELIDPLGERIPALINANLLRDKLLGDLLGIIFIIRDIRG